MRNVDKNSIKEAMDAIAVINVVVLPDKDFLSIKVGNL
jgi:hypothetical protein